MQHLASLTSLYNYFVGRLKDCWALIRISNAEGWPAVPSALVGTIPLSITNLMNGPNELTATFSSILMSIKSKQSLDLPKYALDLVLCQVLA